MQQIPQPDSQLDRIEAGVNQLNQRMARLEERQAGQGAKLESHESQIGEHAGRIHSLELQHAVAKATAGQQGKQLMGRWSAVGATGLVVLGAIAAAIGKAITNMIGIGP
ncbi:hypothetical protein [Halomonas sp. B23F22_10]|uniref:hypothetical protein n=1 Tax=Halomonas sp. B23F22_10 TaxID=3459515 RepID=UPI00373E21EC